MAVPRLLIFEQVYANDSAAGTCTQFLYGPFSLVGAGAALDVDPAPEHK